MKKVICMVLVLTMLLGGLSACASKPPSVAPTDQAAEKPPEATTATTTEEAKPPEAEGEPVYGGTLNIALNGSVSAKSLDPLYIDSPRADNIMQQFGDNLVITDDNNDKFLPSIATDWTISGDGLVYTFTIRDDVYFHPGKFQDGRKMTTEDVAYSVNRAKGYWVNYLYYLDRAEVVDEHTVAAYLMEPNETFLYTLTSSSVVMVPKEEVDGWGEEFGMHPIGTGPFMVTEHVVDQYTVLVKNPKYWGVEPYLDGIKYFIITDPAQTINALETGEIDIALTVTGEGIPQVQSMDNVSLYQTPEARVSFIGFNSSKEYLSDPKVRKALVMAVDTEALNAGVNPYNAGTHSRLAVPIISWAYDKDIVDLLPKYDPEGAKALLKEAGYGDGFKLKFTGTNDTDNRAATILQAYWAAVGVDLEISTVSIAELTASILDNTNVVWMRSQGGSPDPATFVGYFLSTAKLNTNYNAFQYSNPATDELITQGLSTNDMNKRAEIYKELNTIAAEYNLGIFFSTLNLTWGVSNKVHGFKQQSKYFMKVVDIESNGINIWKEK